MCNSEKVVYQATIFPMENSKKEWVYIGISSGNWEERFYNHRHFFPSFYSETKLKYRGGFGVREDESWRFSE